MVIHNQDLWHLMNKQGDKIIGRIVKAQTLCKAKKLRCQSTSIIIKAKSKMKSNLKKQILEALVILIQIRSLTTSLMRRWILKKQGKRRLQSIQTIYSTKVGNLALKNKKAKALIKANLLNDLEQGKLYLHHLESLFLQALTTICSVKKL